MAKINIETDLRSMLNRNKDGSYSTQYNRKAVLLAAGKRLTELGFYNLPATALKQKHVEALLNSWKADGLSTGTIKNRMAHMRWWAEKIGKNNLISRDNDQYDIGRRKYVTNQSKAYQLPADALEKIEDARLRSSIELQNEFGLRREECLKFQPSYAINGDIDSIDKIQLKASWTKGGRAREIPITSQSQRDALKRAQALAGNGSMIPPDEKYHQRMNKYNWEVKKQGFDNLHGLRHNYAQERYKSLTGWDCPAQGGKTSRQLSVQEKEIDRKARLQISSELGHGREAITAVYLGR